MSVHIIYILDKKWYDIWELLLINPEKKWKSQSTIFHTEDV